MMQVVGNEQVCLGMQLGLGIALGIVRRAVRELHQALIGHADALAAIMARVTGFHRDTGVFHITVLDLGLSCALDLARLGIHQRALHPIGIAGVALPAGIVRYPDGTGIRIEIPRSSPLFQAFGRSLMSLFLGQALRITTMTDNTARRIAVAAADCLDLHHHGALFVPDIFDPLMTAVATLLPHHSWRYLVRYGSSYQARVGPKTGCH